MVYDPVSCRFSVVLVVEVLVGDDEGGGALLKFFAAVAGFDTPHDYLFHTIHPTSAQYGTLPTYPQ